MQAIVKQSEAEGHIVFNNNNNNPICKDFRGAVKRQNVKRLPWRKDFRALAAVLSVTLYRITLFLLLSLSRCSSAVAFCSIILVLTDSILVAILPSDFSISFIMSTKDVVLISSIYSFISTLISLTLSSILSENLLILPETSFCKT